MNPELNQNRESSVEESSQEEHKSTAYPEAMKGMAAVHASSTAVDTYRSDNEQKVREVDPTSDMPMPVVKVLSVRGVEYVMMTISLWVLASALTWALLAVVNGQGTFKLLAFPISLMLVSLPIFALLYLRLRKAELENPVLRLDASKRRLSQITQILAFITCLSNLIAFVYILLSKIGGESSISLGKSFMNLIVVLLIAGGILLYYWADEHRIKR